MWLGHYCFPELTKLVTKVVQGADALSSGDPRQSRKNFSSLLAEPALYIDLHGMLRDKPSRKLGEATVISCIKE